MSRQGRVALLVVVITIASAAQLVSARSASMARFSTQDEISISSTTGLHDDSAVVPASRLTRGAHAMVKFMGVPLAGVIALVALLAMWFTASLRRREQVEHALATYRRRGPPAPLHVA